MARTVKQPDDSTLVTATAVGPGRLELRIASDPATLREVRQRLEAFAAARGCDRQCCDDLGLCVNEALANVMRHAYGGATDRPIVIEAEDAGARLQVRIRDWGAPFDPAMLKKRQYDPLEPGGLGVICMRQLMDNVTWTPQDKGMLLTLTRHKCGR